MDVLLHTQRCKLLSFFTLTLCGLAYGQTPLTDPVAIEESSSDAVDEAKEPYVVFVSGVDAHAWCGPGKQYYQTEKLRRGQELNVYLETDDGWLGIQPPQESFCWLPESAVEEFGGGARATVRKDETPVWIGTNLGRAAKYLWQIELHAGEEVTVINRVVRPTKQGEATWLRIVPPSGEFRWVHREDIVESAEQLVEAVTVSAQELTPIDREPLSKREPRVVQAASVDSTGEEAESSSTPDPRKSTRRVTPNGKLSAVANAPTLAPAPTAENPGIRGEVPDRPIHFLRGARPEDYRDRGAVVGSGLKEEWGDRGDSVLDAQELTQLPANGAAAAAAAIAAPLRKVSDVVANFVSSPRFVEINGGSQTNADTAMDRRWMVGSTRENRVGNGFDGAPVGERSMAMIQADGRFANNPTQGAILQTGALLPLETQPRTIAQASRVVTTEQIARVENAVAGIDIAGATRVLSQLMAEAASADEVDPLIRRIQALQAMGDIAQATQTRQLLGRASEYRDLAARRDGATRIQSTIQPAASLPMMASQSISGPAPIPTSAPLVAPASAQTPVPMPAQAQVPAGSTATGYLVQVFSSRSDRPPFALTDDAGLTVAYVTPYPGVNLRSHLNSRIQVRGNERMLPEMNTPHLLVDRVLRR
ncbi:MAG: hypothetical protein AAFU85_02060 [Planctomycetota bacterium]